MPDIVTEVTQAISQTEGGSPAPCFGLPGQNATGTYCNVSLTAHVGVDTSHDIWVWFGGQITHERILNGEYPVVLIASRSDFSFSYSGGRLTWSGDSIECASTTVWVGTDVDPTHGRFVWDFGGGSAWTRIGNVSEMDGTFWIGGTATYSVTNPVYPDPTPIQIADWEELINYFPCAVRSGSDWLSCNRTGGNVQRRESGMWVDKRNTQNGDPATNTVFARQGGVWVAQQEVGIV